ncbi:MAG: thiamine pyrophosphate-requiring protein [Chloroflexota bacterium]
MPPSKRIRMNGADALLRGLKQLGVDYIFGNVGTDFPPIIGSFSRFQQAGTIGQEVPIPMTMPHENTGVHMAYGYYLATGKPQVVFVHTTVGTANALMGMINANRAQVPLIVVAGRAPTTEAYDHTSKPGFIHWGQEMFDQAGMVREHTKWDYHISTDSVVEIDLILQRAMTMATAYPPGPVYLTFVPEAVDRELELPERVTPPTPISVPQPDPASVAQVSEWFNEARLPLIVTGGTARDHAILPALQALAEERTVPVASLLPRNLHFPLEHPLFLGINPHAAIPDADLIISLETDVPYMPLHAQPKEDCRVVHIGPDPVFQRYPRRGYRSDAYVTSGTVEFIQALHYASDTPDQSMADVRTAWATQIRMAKSAKRAQPIKKAQETGELNFGWISYCIAEAASANPEIITLREFDLDSDYLDAAEPGQHVGISNAGWLGWGLGTALGLRLADRSRIPLVATGDGCYYFGNPTSAHSVAASQQLPYITVIYNNGKWATVANHTNRWYADLEEPEPPLTGFGFQPSFHKIVEAFGGHGECVTTADELPAALTRSIEAARNGQQALINVLCESPIERGEVH